MPGRLRLESPVGGPWQIACHCPRITQDFGLRPCLVEETSPWCQDGTIGHHAGHCRSLGTRPRPIAQSNSASWPDAQRFSNRMLRSNDMQPRSNTYYAWGVCGALLLAIGLIYGQSLGHILLNYDDNVFVYQNPHVTAGLTGEAVRWAFTDGPYGEWYPLTMLSHMLDCQLFGLDAWGHHLTNLLIHAAASIALFLVLWRMTGELWPSAFVAAVFAVHPQHVESVAWVAERKDVLSGLFFVLTLGAYLGYVRHGRSLTWYVLVTVLFALGLLAKPMVVTLPPLLLLLDFWPLARIDAAIDSPRWTASVERPGAVRLVLEKLPLVALAAGDCLMTLRTHATEVVVLPWSVRLGNAPVSCVNYIVGFFYPVDLAAFYPIPPGGPPAWKVAGAVAILSVVSAAAVIWRRRCPYCFVGWFWYLGMLAPVLGVVKIGWLAMADRYMYLPGIGLCIALAWAGARFAAGSRSGRWALGTCAALAITILIDCATWQTSFWRDDETLWTHALECTTDNGEAEVGLADALVQQGRFDEAIAYYRRAEQHATDSSPFNNLGLLLAQLGRLDEAIAHFHQALAIEPNSFRVYANLATALAEQNRFDESKKYFRRALEIYPLSVDLRCTLAHHLLLEEAFDEARVEFERVVELDPRNTAARNNLGLTLLRLGKIDQSIAQFEAVLAIDPEFLLAHINLARALAARGQIDEAQVHYRRALEIDPENSVARQELDKLPDGSAKPPAP
jgi:tetratricopeptide (TPR) repeat protein